MRQGYLLAVLCLTLTAETTPRLGSPLPGAATHGAALKDLVLTAPAAPQPFLNQLSARRVAWKERPGAPVLVDGAGIVRRVFDAKMTRAAIIEDIGLWQRGQALYTSYCERCHGPDGTDTTYPGTKSMAGIGNRKSEAEIIEISGRAASVDMSAFSTRDLRALGVYIAGF